MLRDCLTNDVAALLDQPRGNLLPQWRAFSPCELEERSGGALPVRLQELLRFF